MSTRSTVHCSPVMKQIRPTSNEHNWPRNAVKSIECRKRDLVIRIAD